MKKKYYFILKGYPRLSETFIAQEIHLLEERGYDIEIISMRQPREAQRQPINEKIKATVHYLPEYILKEPIAFIKSTLFCLLKYRLTFLILLLKATAKSLMANDKEEIKRFLQTSWALDNINFDLPDLHVHSHFIHSPTTIAFNMHKILGLNYSISAHAKDIYTIPEKEVMTKVEHSRFLTTCTRFNFEFLKERVLSKEKVFLSYHGIDTDFFNPSQNETYPSRSSQDDKVLLCSVGRLVEKKGYDIILAALSLLKEKGINFRYDLIGAGDLQEKVDALIKKYKLEDEVKLFGAITHREIIERFQDKGIYLCGSQITKSGDRDGIPNTIAEAMSMELIVIATRVSGIPELIVNEKSGLLIPSQDSKAMCEAILKLIENPIMSQSIAKEGRSRVKDFFNSRTCINHIDNLFKSINE